MSKLLPSLLAGAALLALSGTVVAADQQTNDSQAPVQANPVDRKPDQRDAERVQQNQQEGSQTQAQPNPVDRKPDQRDAERVQQNQNAGAAATERQSQNQGAANDPTQQNQTENQAGQAGADEGNMGRKPDQPGGTVTADQKEYLADVEKCGALSSDQKEQCIIAAKKKAGQM